jgi:tetratricopeptide (TPR) repeat protein
LKIQGDMNDKDKNEKTAFLSMARTYLEQGLYKEALDLSESWLKQYPMDADTNIIYCHALVKMGKLDKLEEVLGSVENAILQLSRVYSLIGDLCLEGGLTREAIRCYQKFISINPGSSDAEKVSSKLRMLTSTPDDPSDETEGEHHDQISDVAPDFHTLTLAELYIRQGHLQMAADVLNEILKNDTGDSAAARRFNEVKHLMKDKECKEKVVQELSQWLKNIDRMGCHVS